MTRRRVFGMDAPEREPQHWAIALDRGGGGATPQGSTSTASLYPRRGRSSAVPGRRRPAASVPWPNRKKAPHDPESPTEAARAGPRRDRQPRHGRGPGQPQRRGGSLPRPHAPRLVLRRPGAQRPSPCGARRGALIGLVPLARPGQPGGGGGTPGRGAAAGRLRAGAPRPHQRIQLHAGQRHPADLPVLGLLARRPREGSPARRPAARAAASGRSCGDAAEDHHGGHRRPAGHRGSGDLRNRSRHRQRDRERRQRGRAGRTSRASCSIAPSRASMSGSRPTSVRRSGPPSTPSSSPGPPARAASPAC